MADLTTESYSRKVLQVFTPTKICMELHRIVSIFLLGKSMLQEETTHKTMPI